MGKENLLSLDIHDLGREKQTNVDKASEAFLQRIRFS